MEKSNKVEAKNLKNFLISNSFPTLSWLDVCVVWTVELSKRMFQIQLKKKF